ncbi:AAA-like domain-containing protein [Allocoleopsis sp.]|uniref:AAA-like domain-containing protein n=1 Tax=Allocoleopsis sp. TaxID=3088169 RepID=UPI002FD0B3D5
MPRQHYGPEAKKQTKRLLEALLAYANHELENCERIQIKFNWKTDSELVVETKVRFLEELTAKAQPDGKLKKEQIKEALHRLEKFLEILEDNRATTQGSEDWHFTLKLWHRRYDKEANLKRFDVEWERRRPEKSKQVTGEDLKESVPHPSPPWQASKHPPKSIPVPEVPEGPVALTSIFYVDRPPIESRSCQTITQAGALIRIKAPRQMGKTSLLDRIVDRAVNEGYRTVRLNLLQAEGAVFSSLDKFLRWFCACVSHKLNLPSQLGDYWDEDRGSIVNCTTYFEAHLLEQIDSPLVLALDEVDRVFQSAEIAQGFFPMLRSWHEEAKTIDIWEQLRLVVVHSTEDYGPLDINQSPFNVGLPVELTEFTPEQVKDLAQRHQLDWQETQVQHLMAMVGGHPYLVRLALYNLAYQDLTLEQLLQDAPTDAGIYEEHLRRHWRTLKENSQLAAALQQVVTAAESVRLETMQAYKLYSMGLIKRIGDRVTPRCQLYQQYFRERLSN